MALIKAKSISKSYRDNQVIDDISFEIEEGRFYTILGLNGAGKSTLLNLLSGRITKDKSEAEVFGIEMGEDLGELRNDIAYVSEQMTMSSSISIKKFLKVYALQFKNWNQEYFEQLNSHRKLDLNDSFMNFSRGQKMQFFLMIALAQTPKILFVDEITSVLDFKARDFFLAEIEKIKLRGGTILLTTNIITEVHRASTDLIILKDKKLAYAGTKIGLFNKYKKLRDTQDKIVPINEDLFDLGIDAFGKHSYLIKDSLLTNELESFILEEGPNLGEVFVYLTDGEVFDD